MSKNLRDMKKQHIQSIITHLDKQRKLYEDILHKDISCGNISTVEPLSQNIKNTTDTPDTRDTTDTTPSRNENKNFIHKKVIDDYIAQYTALYNRILWEEVVDAEKYRGLKDKDNNSHKSSTQIDKDTNANNDANTHNERHTRLPFKIPRYIRNERGKKILSNKKERNTHPRGHYYNRDKYQSIYSNANNYINKQGHKERKNATNTEVNPNPNPNILQRSQTCKRQQHPTTYYTTPFYPNYISSVPSASTLQSPAYSQPTFYIPFIRSAANIYSSGHADNNTKNTTNTNVNNVNNTNNPQPQTHPQYTTHPEDMKKERKKIHIQKEIQCLEDLIRLIDEHPLSEDIEYNINMEALHAIYDPLMELNQMVGMKTLKNAIVDQIIYFIQGLQATEGDFMHTCIYGPPGTGKTEIAKVMGKIFSRMGILKKNTFRKVTRSDLVAGYLGQTAIKTRDVIREALGGVLFIDEAYSLGNAEKRDSFAKECIDTLCEALSNHKNELMVIVAGYEEDLQKCFFAFNQGLDSRFTWRFKTDDYSAEELRNIFLKKVHNASWSVVDMETSLPVVWFEENRKYFTFYGRDMETLFSKVKIAHSRRVFCLTNEEKRKIVYADLEKGFQLFLENDEVKKRVENLLPEYIKNMYT